MVHETTKRDPERIYLEPWPYSPEGRQWCADDVWPLDGDGPGGVEYVRADLATPEPGGEGECEAPGFLGLEGAPTFSELREMAAGELEDTQVPDGIAARREYEAAVRRAAESAAGQPGPDVAGDLTALTRDMQPPSALRGGL